MIEALQVLPYLITLCEMLEACPLVDTDKLAKLEMLIEELKSL